MVNNGNLTEGSVGKRLLMLTLPLVLGTFSSVMFNFVDTYFVAKIGTRELAAMSFTFPVIMVLIGVAIGLGTGAGAVISITIGEGNMPKVRRLTTDILILAFVVSFFISVIGILTINPLFRLLGASADIISLIRQYMVYLYAGILFMIVPIVCNNTMRASGDTFYPSLMMMVAAGINVLLDPILIFGLGGFPKLGLAGAAISTVIARFTTFVCVLYIIHYKEKMIDFSIPSLSDVFESWRKILYIGIPSTATNMLIPFSMGVVTHVAARFGMEAVAAMGAGIRIEAVALIVIMALRMSLVPFVGQNWGAKRYDRVNLAHKYSSAFSVVWGIVTVVLFFVFAVRIGHIFSKDTLVISKIVKYLWIVPAGYGLQGISMITTTIFNSINMPVLSALLNLIRMFCLYIPLAYLGSMVFGLDGVFIGITIANVFAGILSLFLIKEKFSPVAIKS